MSLGMGTDGVGSAVKPGRLSVSVDGGVDVRSVEALVSAGVSVGAGADGLSVGVCEAWCWHGWRCWC